MGSFFSGLWTQLTAPILQPGDTPQAGETPSILGAGSSAGTGSNPFSAALAGLGSAMGMGGSGGSQAGQGEGYFDSGWPQLLACILMIIIGLVIFMASLKSVPVVSTVVETGKRAARVAVL